MELELQLLDNKGRVVNKAKELLESIKKDPREVNIEHEQTHNMVELKSFPKVKLKDSLPTLFENLEVVLEKAEKLDLKIFGLGSFPGHFEAKHVNKKRYKLQSQIFNGKNVFNWSHCSGFHYHYTLPWGVFDSQKSFLKKLFDSKTKQSMIDSYNLLIAADPATSTLMQSSPFLERRYLAKDSRMLLIRNPFELNYPQGLFSELPKFGELPDYIMTLQDLRHRLLRMDKKFKKLIEKTTFKKEAKKKELLDFLWTAVKVNKLGTLEQRGCDMNHPKYFAAIAVLFKSIQRVVQQEFYRVEISDIAIKEPFKIEGEKILIPPQSYVKLKLQPASAYKGFEDPEIYNYVKRFFNFAKKHSNKDYLKLLIPLKRLIERKKTVSDVLIGRVKKKGYSLDELIPQEVCAEIALKHAEEFAKGTFKTKSIIPE